MTTFGPLRYGKTRKHYEEAKAHGLSDNGIAHRWCWTRAEMREFLAELMIEPDDSISTAADRIKVFRWGRGNMSEPMIARIYRGRRYGGQRK